MENTRTPWKSYLAMTQTDLPVMKPFQLAPAKPVGEVCLDILSQRRFCLCLLAVLLAWISVDAAIAQSRSC